MSKTLNVAVLGETLFAYFCIVTFLVLLSGFFVIGLMVTICFLKSKVFIVEFKEFCKALWLDLNNPSLDDDY